jgi:thiol:disulfide interchange protein
VNISLPGYLRQVEQRLSSAQKALEKRLAEAQYEHKAGLSDAQKALEKRLAEAQYEQKAGLSDAQKALEKRLAEAQNEHKAGLSDAQKALEKRLAEAQQAQKADNEAIRKSTVHEIVISVVFVLGAAFTISAAVFPNLRYFDTSKSSIEKPKD